MNEIELERLNELNERYGPTNLTGFRIVDDETSLETVLKHIETDLKILNSSEVKYKHVYRIIARCDSIDICTVDNGTIISYFFIGEGEFMLKFIKGDLKILCEEFDVHFEE